MSTTRRPDTLISHREVHDMFEVVAPRYDLLNRVLSLGIDAAWRRLAIRSLELGVGDLLVDVCGGTGDMAIEAMRTVGGVRVLNVDFSHNMLRIAAAKRGRRGVGAGVCGHGAEVRGDAMALPLPAGRAAGVAIAFGIRNVPDRRAAIAEFHRVLAPGGRLAILEFGTPRSRLVRAPYLLYLRHVLPRLAAIVTHAPAAYGYLGDSILDFPEREEFGALLTEAGFTGVGWRDLSHGIAVLYEARR